MWIWGSPVRAGVAVPLNQSLEKTQKAGFICGPEADPPRVRLKDASAAPAIASPTRASISRSGALQKCRRPPRAKRSRSSSKSLNPRSATGRSQKRSGSGPGRSIVTCARMAQKRVKSQRKTVKARATVAQRPRPARRLTSWRKSALRGEARLSCLCFHSAAFPVGQARNWLV